MTTPLQAPGCAQRPAFSAMPKFSGEWATKMAETGTPDSFLSCSGMKKAVRKDVDPYLGKLPPALADSGLSPAETLEKLDDLAKLLRERFPKKSLEKAQPFRYPLGKLTLDVIPCGEGMFAQVFKIKAGDEVFAFKSFYGDRELLRNGPYWESAIGLYLTARQAKDLVRFHVGNPKALWYIAEFIDPAKANLAERSGQTVEELGFHFVGEKEANRIAGIRIDYGTAWPVKGVLDNTTFYLTRTIRSVARPLHKMLTGL